MASKKHSYCGDGLYASFDGFQIGISVNDHRNEPVAYLEHDVFMNFMKFGLACFGMQAVVTVPPDSPMLGTPSESATLQGLEMGEAIIDEQIKT